MENITKYIGFIIVFIGALIMLVVFMMGNVTNTSLAIAGGLGVIGLLVQIFIGRSVDY